MHRNVPARGLSTLSSIVLHAGVVIVVLAATVQLVGPGMRVVPKAAGITQGAHAMDDALVAQAVAEVFEATEEVQPQAVVAREPAISDAAIPDRVGTDDDLPFEASVGETEGWSGGPFEGPQDNATLGT